MDHRCKIAVALTACQLVWSGCHRAEIDLGEALAEMGNAGQSEVVGGEGGADAGMGGDVGEMGGEAGSGELIDTTPPLVLATSPDDRQPGVLSSEKVLIRFSEPMNRAQTESAVTITGVQAAFEWNEHGTELTLIPLEGFQYGHAADPKNVTAIMYSLSVNSSASDVAGNALAKEHSSTFYTSRELTTSLTENVLLTGYAIDSDNPRDSTVGTNPWVGDVTDDESMRGFVTADLSRLPAETQAVTSATLTAEQYEINGEPYRMGNMIVEHVSFSALEFVFRAPVRKTQPIGVLFRDPKTKSASVDVTSALQMQLAERDNDVGEVQFRFAFEEPVYANGISDEVRLLPLTIKVSYLIP